MERFIGLKYLTIVGGIRMDIKELVIASQKGDINSFVSLIKIKEDTIYRIAYTYTSNSYDAEDCISEAVLHSFDKIKQLKNAEKFYVWFISILVNICRKRYKVSAREDEFIAEIHEVPVDNAFTDNSIVVKDLLNYLKKDERDILILRYLKDFSIEEIARILRIPNGTVKSRLNRTISRIKLKYGRFF
jgi:RNA polymerase sigma-70 factor (ECF subfamily)